MARRRHESLDTGEIEFLEGDLADGFDVDLSGHQPPESPADPEHGRRTRAWWIVGGVAAVALGLVGVAVLTSGDDPLDVAPTTTRRTTTTSTTEPITLPSAVGTSVVTVAPQTTADVDEPVPGSFPPLVPTGSTVVTTSSIPTIPDTAGFIPGGTTIYLWDTASGTASLVAYDVDTAQLTPVDIGQVSWVLRAVVPTPEGPIVDAGELIDATGDVPRLIGEGDEGQVDFERTGARVVAAPLGLVWVRTLNPAQIALIDPVDQRVLREHPLPLGFELIGSSIDGDPIVRGSDLRAFQIMQDGSTMSFGDGITTRVEQGRYADVTCGLRATTDCVVTLVGMPGVSTAFSLPQDLDRTAIRISPTGDYAAIAVDDDVRIVSTSTGDGVDVPLSYLPTGSPVSPPAANYFRVAHDLVWTLDGKVLAFLTPEGIALVNVDGVPVANVVLDPADPLRYVPLAMG